ncbi:effector binding domain-containing protein [Flavobacterium hauense]
MKIVKYIFLLLLLSVVAVSVFIATQEGKYDIKKESVIRVPKMVLYNYINEYKNWENLGILTGSDTTAIYTYSENSSGSGAMMSWKKDRSEGQIKTIKLAENDSIIQKAVIDGLNSDIAWNFKDTLKSTKVTVRMKGDLSFMEKANAFIRGGGNVNKVMESSLDNGLKNLNAFLIDELSKSNVEVKGLITKTGANYIGHAVTSKIEDINKKSAEIFPKLLNFMKKNKMVKQGAPFIFYRNYDKTQGTASYVVCIPIKDEMFTSPGSEYEGGKYAGFNALKTTLKGDYSHLPKAWDAAHAYITEKALQENTTGTYIELYSKGVQKSKRPSEWITDLYIPIGPPTILPITDSIQAPAALTPVKPAVVTPTTAGARPAAATNKPAGTTTATGTAKPTVTGTKPAATTTTGTKPATTAPKPGGTATKPATKPAGTTATGTSTHVKPAAKPATTTGTTAPKPAETKPTTNNAN